MNNKTDLKIINGEPMMGSRSIADMTGKDHSSVVVRDIKNMLKQLNIYPAIPQDNENKSFFIKMKTYNGREVIEEIFLDQDLSTTLVTGYSVQERYKVIKRWGDLESGKAQPRIAAQPGQPEIGINPDFAALTRTVAEATAAGVMKSILETTGIQAVVHISATVSTPSTAALVNHVGHAAQTAQEETKEPEYVPVHKVSWATGLSDPTCRRLVTFSDLPNCHIDGVRGLCVHREFFMAAAEVLIKESTPPAKGRKRWHHPEFGGFELRKDPAEIFREDNHGE